MNPRILELALETLESKKAEIDKEIAELKQMMGDAKPVAAAPAKRERRQKTPAERRAHSEAMKAYWAKKKAATKKSQKS